MRHRGILDAVHKTLDAAVESFEALTERRRQERARRRAEAGRREIENVARRNGIWQSPSEQLRDAEAREGLGRLSRWARPSGEPDWGNELDGGRPQIEPGLGNELDEFTRRR